MKTLLWILAAIAVVVLAIILFDINITGETELPDVSVTGGQAPNVDIRGPEVTTGTTTMEVPTMDMQLPEDDMQNMQEQSPTQPQTY